mgnify:CR=1 FL=1
MNIEGNNNNWGEKLYLMQPFYVWFKIFISETTDLLYGIKIISDWPLMKKKKKKKKKI